MPVSLRYKGEKKFYTNFGALTSVIIILLMVAYIGTEIKLMLSQTQYEQTQTVLSVVERDQATGSQAYSNVVANGVYADMTFGMRAFHNNFTQFNDPSYFTLRFLQQTQSYSTFYKVYTSTTITVNSTNCLNHPLFRIDPDTGLTPLDMNNDQLY